MEGQEKYNKLVSGRVVRALIVVTAAAFLRVHSPLYHMH